MHIYVAPTGVQEYCTKHVYCIQSTLKTKCILQEARIRARQGRSGAHPYKNDRDLRYQKITSLLVWLTHTERYTVHVATL